MYIGLEKLDVFFTQLCTSPSSPLTWTRTSSTTTARHLWKKDLFRDETDQCCSQ